MITQNTKTMTYPNVLIVDDEIITSEFVRLILERYDINVTGVAETPKKALQIFSEGKTDLIICDIDLRNGISGIDFVRHAKQLRPTHVIYLTGLTDEDTLKTALETQPDAYITKPFTHNQLIATLMTIVNDTKFNKKVDIGPVPTKRELQIIENLARGMTSYQIASAMNISFETVQTYRKRILNKFGVNSSSEIIVLAMKKRWINLSFSDPTLF
jgi:DNA-binding NarL/FixJ family response regulator